MSHTAAQHEHEALLDKRDIYERRRAMTSKAQSVSYENTDPLLIVRGDGQYLFDERGTRFLDTRNNVCHVGHCNTTVADAVAAQVYKLNTNARYLHPNHVELCTQLLATMPAPLDAASGANVFIVNSGSEANDLALRLARAHTGRKQTIVIEHAYHGHTCELIGISPYKSKHGTASVPGSTQPDWVSQVRAPDTYRGPHNGPTAGDEYAQEVVALCQHFQESADGGVAAFFTESGMSVAGVIIPPDGYLQRCYAAVRAAGGVCVADEVQTGFGRFGKHFWAFQQSGVVPDIVTMGKPFGNGMPLAAVVCTAAIGKSFANGPEYFNTFGGNPVCCAAGLAVLSVVRDRRLQEHAATVGDYLVSKLRAVADTPTSGALIGDVRGAGLFVGIEFASDRSTKVPASAATSWVCSQLKVCALNKDWWVECSVALSQQEFGVYVHAACCHYAPLPVWGTHTRMHAYERRISTPS
eukprot:m.1535620 g.1535620  ORF g.1535620 m.1535620 type:complete len:468 (+) comp25243_c0_seq79:355-1758(+)